MVSGENVSKAASDSGLFFVPELCGAVESMPTLGGFGGAVSALSDSERHRLVKGTKSPTSQQSPLNAKIFQHLALERSPTFTRYIEPTPEPKNTTGAGAFTVVGHREWSGEYRIRTEVHGTVKQSPPENTGDRVTEMLTTRGARKIAESCEFMHLKRGGYTTFLTLTLDLKARERVDNGETTIQNEVSRFFDGLQKMYQRGFEGSLIDKEGNQTGEFFKMEGASDKLDYLWVAESPDNIEEKTGEITGENPHVHVLMRYRVPFKAFNLWSRRIEKLWGQGFAHLEKIKDGEKAGAYMAKAAGYLCKAQGKNDQGTIRGNRYNISKSARAPDWVCVGRFQLGRMGFLLSEASENFDDKFGFVKKKRDKLSHKLKSAVGKDRQKIGALLEKTRKVLKRMPRLSKYQAILKGEEQYTDFMKWAANDAPVSGHSWLPEKNEGESFLTVSGRGQWLNEYTIRRRIRKNKRAWSSWFSDARQMAEYYFCGDVLRSCFESEFLADIDEKEDYLSDYNEWLRVG